MTYLGRRHIPHEIIPSINTEILIKVIPFMFNVLTPYYYTIQGLVILL